MSPMKRLYRVMLDGAPSYVIDDGGALRRVATADGGIFEGIRAGDAVVNHVRRRAIEHHAIQSFHRRQSNAPSPLSVRWAH